MRPLRLVIAGLNSFKEPQEIDFSRLCQGNVFGIFGPTGSGKSTVVDAITLALYGSVERASRRTQGIVNKALTEAGVLFEWQLGDGRERKTYRVERKYLAKEDSVNCRLARLCELREAETIVLADKPSQVDQAVQEILGLTEDDFTRAVVLPQGRFAEFLNLQGSERRRMLERIFGLEEYGEQLYKLAGERLKATETALQATVRSQEVLGAATVEDVAAAERQVEAGAAELSARKAAAEGAREEQQRWGRIRERQQELQQVRAGLRELAERSERIADLRAKMERQAAAERVAGPLRAADAAARRAEEAGVNLRRLAVAAAQAETAEREAQAALQQAQLAKEQREEPLVKQLEQLERAVRLERQATDLQQELLARRQTGQALSADLQQQADVLAVSRSTALELTDTLTKLQAELGQNRIEPQQREQLRAVLAAEQRWQTAVEQLQEVTAELQTRAQQLAVAERQAELARQELAIHARELSGRQAALEQLRRAEPAAVAARQLELASDYLTGAEQLAAADRELAQRRQALAEQTALVEQLQQQLLACAEQTALDGKAVAAAQARVTDLESRLSVRRERSLAARLAHGLQPGQPCPVCGAVAHPAPAQADDDGEADQLEAELAIARAEWQALQAQLAKAEAQLSTRQTDQERQHAALAACRDRLRAAAAKVDEQLAQLPRQWAADTAWADLPQRAKAHLSELNEGIQRRSRWQAELNQAGELAQACADRVSQCRQGAELGRQAVANQTDEIKKLTDKQAGLRTQAELRQTELQRCLHDLGGTDAAAVRARHLAMDQRAEALAQSISQQQRQHDDLVRQIAEVEQRVAALRERQAQARTEYRLQQERLTQLQSELQTITGGEAAATLRETATEQLAQLRRQAAAAQQVGEQARQQVAVARQGHSAGQEADRLAGAAAQETRTALEASLRQQQFATREQALEALSWSDLLPEWQQQVRSYDQQQDLLQRRSGELTAQLAGQAIAEAEWLTLVQQTQAAAAAHEQAIAALAQAGELLNQVRGRHAQWLELEASRMQADKEQGLLSELVSLLRGNALVEFMAGEHLDAIAGLATDWLGLLTGRRYALETAPDGGFLIRDDGNGGERRPVYTLSGGETFITSLALALALSSQVQLRGKHRLEFFFLDEGFGSLDPELLEVVMGCLERVQGQQMSIGVISHVPELRERILRQVLVIPAEPGGRGSRVRLAIG